MWSEDDDVEILQSFADSSEFFICVSDAPSLPLSICFKMHTKLKPNNDKHVTGKSRNDSGIKAFNGSKSWST